MIQIRPLTDEMIASFVDLHLSCFQKCYQSIYSEEVFLVREQKREQRMEHIKARLHHDKNYFYFALCDDFSVVGIMIFSIVDQEGLLDALYLDQAYQRQGYGTKLIQAMELTLQQFGILTYRVYVSKLISATKFFEKCHAQFVREEPISIHGKDYIEYEYVVKVGDNI